LVQQLETHEYRMGTDNYFFIGTPILYAPLHRN
jgi:hypothetical protein